MFDSRTKAALAAALAQVEKKFGEQMQKELETLQQQNSAKLDALEGGLTKQITEQEKDLKARSDYQHCFAQALAFAFAGRHSIARDQFRRALTIYKYTRPKKLIEKKAGGAVALENLFLSFRREDEAKFMENAKKELADELYKDPGDELALAAVNLDWLAPLL